MLIIASEKEINDKINSLSNEPLIRNEYGKPYFKNSKLKFNKSNTLDLSVLIIEEVECGIDIEYIRKYNDIMAKEILSKEEKTFINNTDNKDLYFTILWTLKESYLKCIGTGINTKLNELNMIEDNKIIKTKNNYKLNYFIYEDKYIISYCKR